MIFTVIFAPENFLHLKMDVRETIARPIFRGYVSFREDIFIFHWHGGGAICRGRNRNKCTIGSLLEKDSFGVFVFKCSFDFLVN